MVALTMAAALPKPDSRVLLPLEQYDFILVSFSGGKDSLALVLDLLDRGVPRERIQLWHQCVDGEPGVDATFMDWPSTEGYVRAVAAYLGVRVLFQWRQGGFLGEMLKRDGRTRPVRFETQAGGIAQAGGLLGKVSTRERYPQKTSDLRVRWCSAVLKIDVAALAVNNEVAFKNARILFLTGERREEGRNGTGRALYAEKEPHRSDCNRRRVDAWRSVIDWSEERVWDAMRRWGVRPHAAYRLGFSRVSCLGCIFGLPDQWATIRQIAPEQFDRILFYERLFGCTITQGRDVEQMADRGTPYPAARDKGLVRLAMSRSYPPELASVAEGHWELPAGAFKHGGGPG